MEQNNFNMEKIILDDYDPSNKKEEYTILDLKNHISKFYSDLILKKNHDSEITEYIISEIKNIENKLQIIYENSVSQKIELHELSLKCSKLEHNQESFKNEILKFNTSPNLSMKDLMTTEDFSEMLQKSKDEYISALQCEMEITRQYLIREIYRGHSSIKGSHGDPLF